MHKRPYQICHRKSPYLCALNAPYLFSLPVSLTRPPHPLNFSVSLSTTDLIASPPYLSVPHPLLSTDISLSLSRPLRDLHPARPLHQSHQSRLSALDFCYLSLVAPLSLSPFQSDGSLTKSLDLPTLDLPCTWSVTLLYKEAPSPLLLWFL
jgi:hypothetical protein